MLKCINASKSPVSGRRKVTICNENAQESWHSFFSVTHLYVERVREFFDLKSSPFAVDATGGRFLAHNSTCSLRFGVGVVCVVYVW